MSTHQHNLRSKSTNRLYNIEVTSSPTLQSSKSSQDPSTPNNSSNATNSTKYTFSAIYSYYFDI